PVGELGFAAVRQAHEVTAALAAGFAFNRVVEGHCSSLSGWRRRRRLSSTSGERYRRRLDARHLLLQFREQLPFVEEGVNLHGGRHVLEGEGAPALLQIDQRPAREGAEVTRLAGQHLGTISERRLEVAAHVIEGGALVPG